MTKLTSVLMLLVVACSGEAVPPGGGGSGGTKGTLVYPTKGCEGEKTQPAPVLVTEGIPDAGVVTYCSCQGKTFEANRGFAIAPWAYEGPCQPGIPVGRVCGAPGMADHWTFTSAGCDGEASVVCVDGSGLLSDGGTCSPVCRCDGRTVCNTTEAYAYAGECRDGGVTD